jgi:fucose 4-O-acetylase-like acetyltransferase
VVSVQSGGEGSTAAPRRLDVDLLKASGILTVVLIHSVRSPWDAGVTEFELWIGSITRFAVPGFLLASGILHAERRRDTAAVTYRRTTRLLIPYFVASIAAQLFWAIEGTGAQRDSIVEDLLLAASFGPFYYVLIALVAVLAAPLLARLSARSLALVTASSIAVQWGFETGRLGILPLFWALRNPGLWFGYVVAGWSLETRRHSRHASRLRSTPARIIAVAAFLAHLALSAAAVSGRIELSFGGSQTLGWLGIYVTVLLVLAFSLGRPSRFRVIRFLGDATYTIFLYHLFFVIPARKLLPAPEGIVDPVAIVAPWIAGILGPILLLLAGRRCLGRHSRSLLGS